MKKRPLNFTSWRFGRIFLSSFAATWALKVAANHHVLRGALLISSRRKQREIHNQHIEIPEECSPAPRTATP
jgi:hypothetical protein